MKVESESEVTQLCPTLSNPTDYSLPGCSGIFQARVLEWRAIAFSVHHTKYLIYVLIRTHRVPILGLFNLTAAL